jgi:sugar/nucleoside kinase (ribokinase family)
MSDTGLLVIGDVVTDVLALHAGPPQPGTDTEADIVVRPGGSAANTAAWAAALGGDVALLGRVGTDTGDWHHSHLAAAGVRPYLRVDPDQPTAIIIVMVDAAGERTFLTNRGAARHLGPADWDDTLLDGIGILHVSGYTLFSEGGRDLARTAVEAARRAGIAISVDPASTGFLADFGIARFLAETAAADIIIPNSAEAQLLTSAATPDEAALRLSEHYGLVVVKLGGDGALAVRDGHEIVRVPAEAASIVDSTGAGDAFAAGFLTALLTGADVPAAVGAACAAGARAVAHLGGRPLTPALPTLPLGTAGQS